MIKNVGNGWSKFNLGSFKGHPSYITSVPIDILEAFIDYHKKGCGCAFFDEEGNDFTLVINPYSLLIIEEKEEIKVYDLSDLNIKELEKELINDIESDIDNWMYWEPCCKFNDNSEKYLKELRDKLNELKKYGKHL